MNTARANAPIGCLFENTFSEFIIYKNSHFVGSLFICTGEISESKKARRTEAKSERTVRASERKLTLQSLVFHESNHFCKKKTIITHNNECLRFLTCRTFL